MTIKVTRFRFYNFSGWWRSLFLLLPAECQTSTVPANIDRKRLSESAHVSASKALIQPEDLEPIEPGSSLKTLRTLRRPRIAPGHFNTISSLIGSVNDGLLTSSKSEDKKAEKYVWKHTRSHTMLHKWHESNRQSDCRVAIWHFAFPVKNQEVGFVGGNIVWLQPEYVQYRKCCISIVSVIIISVVSVIINLADRKNYFVICHTACYGHKKHHLKLLKCILQHLMHIHICSLTGLRRSSVFTK